MSEKAVTESREKPFAVHGMTFRSLGEACDYAQRLIAEGQEPMAVYENDVLVGMYDGKYDDERQVAGFLPHDAVPSSHLA